ADFSPSPLLGPPTPHSPSPSASRLPAPRLPPPPPHGRPRRDPAAPADESLATALLPAALDGARGVALPRFVPFAKRIAMPRRLRLECRQAQLFPHGAGALHEWPRRQRQRRPRAFQGGVDQKRCVPPAAARLCA